MHFHVLLTLFYVLDFLICWYSSNFTTNDLNAGGVQEASPQEEEDGSLTLPDELDTFSDIADAFSASSRQWREEYEARLDAIQKRM